MKILDYYVFKHVEVNIKASGFNQDSWKKHSFHP